MYQRYFPGWEPEEYPITIGLIRLEEGPYIYTNLVNVEADEIRCDLAVEVTFERVTETVTLPFFQPSR